MTIVVGYIPSPEGQAALELALHEALAHRLDVSVVNVVSDESLIDQRAANEDQLAKAAEQFTAAGVEVAVHQRVSHHGRADTLLEQVSEDDASLLVVGVRPRSRTGKFLFGSATQRLILEAPCPVLCAKVRTRPRGACIVQ